MATTKRLVDVSKNETVFISNKWYRIWAMMPLGEDIKYCLVPVINEIWVNDRNTPFANEDTEESDVSYALWTNHLAVEHSRERFPNGQEQLTLF